jgi:solute carrier family 25 folate transporter 32
MSYNRSPTPQATALQSQYASATDTPPILRSFNTMPSPPPDTSFLSRLQIYSTQIPEAYIAPICGAGAGLASGIVTCPLDVIKTKLQAQGGFITRRPGQFTGSTQAYKGMVGTARVIWREEGLRGMYRGLGPMLLGYLPTWAVYLSVYDSTRAYYYDRCGECYHPLRIEIKVTDAVNR